MRMLQRYARFLWEHKKPITHGIVLFTLISVAVWDAQQIIKDYVKDNYFSLVKFHIVEDRFPFLDDARMQVCMTYSANHTVFYELWTNESARMESSSLFNYSLAIERLQNGSEDPLNPLELTLQDRIHVAMVLQRIQVMDDLIARCILDRNLTYCKIPQHVPLTPILKNKAILEQMEMETWSQIRPYIFRPQMSKRSFDPSLEADLYYFNHHNVCVDLPLSVVRPPEKHSPYRDPTDFHIGVISDRNDTLFQEDMPRPIVWLWLPSTSFLIRPVPENPIVKLSITNIGIYERGATTLACSNDPLLRLRTQPIPTAASTRYLRSVAKACNCVPFSYRRQFLSTNPDPTEAAALPACTAQTYTFCVKRLQGMMAAQGDPPPCVSVHNHYSPTLVKPEGVNSHMFYDNSSTQLYSRTKLSLQCVDLVYIVYEERFQMSPQQLVAQVGGNIGLYTGISILGVWQLLAHAYAVYLKRQAAIRERKHSMKITVHRQVLDVFVNYFERTRGQWEHMVAGGSCQSGNPVGRIDIEQRMSQMEKTMEMVVHWMAKMEHRMEMDTKRKGEDEHTL